VIAHKVVTEIVDHGGEAEVGLDIWIEAPNGRHLAPGEGDREDRCPRSDLGALAGGHEPLIACRPSLTATGRSTLSKACRLILPSIATDQ
jgi:hypothetical protein